MRVLRHRTTLTALLGLLALAGAACGDDDTGEVGDGAAPTTTVTAPAETTTTTTAPALLPAPGSTYVALGSSYAAGTGIEPLVDGCRSSLNYPRRVAEALDLELVDVSCGGATTPQVIDQPQGDLPPQAGAVTADTSLVTVTIGGNDIGYIATALGCGDPATECSVDQAALDAGIPQVRSSLLSLIDLLGTMAPEATIVLVTYPVLVPETECAALSFSPTEAALVRDIGERLQGVFLEVASETDIVLVDPYSAPGDHGPCAPDGERWVVGKDPAPGEAFAYHPNADGHAAIADLIVGALG
jgi:lysophospholipase L1-like esterase